ncbi:MFS transporter [Aquabacterium sp. OR-4]|uniref:MFS transporter n=1 Tax=Aquabacterium sp. OR-4 TaxID=2978127 RepID=UPI0021B21EC0|nr:MFS transporter [Aquabacterium sp. OR-4]MDT7834940.1 MFS transporter [Aquabacterium sp. OR-4]
MPGSGTAAPRRSLVALFGATFFELCGIFVFAPLMLFQLKARGLDSTAAGAFAALNWAGVLVATPFASTVVRALGTRRALLLSGVVPVVALAGIQASSQLGLWALLYAASGMAAALRWVLSESLVARLAPAAHRGRMMGLFSTMIGATFMVGPALLAALLARGWSAHQAGWMALLLTVLGLVMMFGIQAPELAAAAAGDAPDGAATPAPRPGLAQALQGTLAALRGMPVVMATGFVGGFFEAGLSGALPLWGLSLGWSQAAAALLVTVSGLGSTLAAAPAGELADRWSVEAMRRSCVAACLLGALLVPWVSLPGGAWLAWPLVVAWGAAGAALYTLSMVEIGHRHTGQGQGVALVDSTAVLVLAYTAGGMLAPAVTGLMIDWAPRFGLAAALAAVALVGFMRPGAPLAGARASP